MTNRRLRRVLAGLPLALAIALPAAPAHAAPTACAAANSSPTEVSAPQLEHTVLCLVNRERTSRGLPRLRSNSKLDRAARSHSRNMVRRNFFSHDTPGGLSVLDRAKAHGYRSGGGLIVGENIAWGSGSWSTPAEIVDGWMHSSGHRANILHRAFKEIGVGVALGAPRPVSGQPAATYTTDFGARR
ncbi:MAG TPA: CAP domain-containing protein [Solirubrobacteraceae bacterium]|nr:CAP domain-containing protein [Solirubrobacteraceae bacterium]